MNRLQYTYLSKIGHLLQGIFQKTLFTHLPVKDPFFTMLLWKYSAMFYRKFILMTFMFQIVFLAQMLMMEYIRWLVSAAFS